MRERASAALSNKSVRAILSIDPVLQVNATYYFNGLRQQLILRRAISLLNG
jgi:hypothetical protein